MTAFPKIALGAWAWGNDGTFGAALSSEDVRPVFEAGKIDFRRFKPVLFEFPTYEYFVTGEKVGDCARMNK